MFQFAGFANLTYVFSKTYRTCGGLPHSEIRGSKVIHTSPRLIAVYHVLHRLLVPRHPPDALLRLIKSLNTSKDNTSDILNSQSQYISYIYC